MHANSKVQRWGRCGPLGKKWVRAKAWRKEKKTVSNSCHLPHLLTRSLVKMKTCPSLSHVWLFATPCSLLGSSVHGIVQERIPGVGSHSLLQGIFPTLGLNPGLLPCRQILYHLSHQGSHRKGTDSLLLLSDPNCILPSSLHFWVECSCFNVLRWLLLILLVYIAKWSPL